MDLVQVLILSISEGITEFLPISSTGHLIIASKLLNIAQTNFVKSFEISIQSGAILAVVWLYWKEILGNKKIFKNTLIAFIPTAIIGFALYKVVKNFLIGNVQITLLMLVLGGFLIVVLERLFKHRKQGLDVDSLSLQKSFLIGTAQALSIIPGVSRSAATILSGMGAGLKREEATKFSFMLAIPTMFAATGYDLVRTAGSFNSSQILSLAVGFIASFLVAVLTIKWFIRFVHTRTLMVFGLYRIAAGIILFLFFQR